MESGKPNVKAFYHDKGTGSILAFSAIAYVDNEIERVYLVNGLKISLKGWDEELKGMKFKEVMKLYLNWLNRG